MNNVERQPIIMKDNTKLFGFIDSGNIVPLILIIVGAISTVSYVNFSIDQLNIDLKQETIDRKVADEKLAEQFRFQFQQYEAVQIQNQKEIREEFRSLRESSSAIQRDLTKYIIESQDD